MTNLAEHSLCADICIQSFSVPVPGLHPPQGWAFLVSLIPGALNPPFANPYLPLPYHLLPQLPSWKSPNFMPLRTLNNHLKASTFDMIYNYGHCRLLRQGMLFLQSATTVIGP
jgi:hypothetical protein